MLAPRPNEFPLCSSHVTKRFRDMSGDERSFLSQPMKITTKAYLQTLPLIALVIALGRCKSVRQVYIAGQKLS